MKSASLIGWVLCAVVVVALFDTAITDGGPLAALDADVARNLHGAARTHDSLTLAARIVSIVGAPAVFDVLAAISAVVLALRRRSVDAVILVVAVAGAAGAQLRLQQAAAADVPSAQRDVARQWQTWRGKQRFTGNYAIPDYANPEQMNRYTWYQTHDWTYPGDPKVYAPSQVPGAYVLSHQDGD